MKQWLSAIMRVQVQAMAAYGHVSKYNPRSKAFDKFLPLRAVGLAYEQGHKLCRARGVLALTVEDFLQVRVAGALRVLDDGRERKARSYTLQLRRQDAELAHKLVLKHVR